MPVLAKSREIPFAPWNRPPIPRGIFYTHIIYSQYNLSFLLLQSSQIIERSFAGDDFEKVFNKIPAGVANHKSNSRS